ncbi:hypothetical protein CEQ36_01070 [Yersinia intermedia]|nr:hypothetical protein A6J67_23225 [Yersinia sp. FDAARGOS_228]AVL34350.1 hypothetical protein CEQ36_01070 [Yersinia intermedia]
MRTVVFAGGKIAICSENYRDHARKCLINSPSITCYEFKTDCYMNVYDLSLKIMKSRFPLLVDK